MRVRRYGYSIDLCEWQIGKERDYYDGWNNALWLGFIVIMWFDTGKDSDVW